MLSCPSNHLPRHHQSLTASPTSLAPFALGLVLRRDVSYVLAGHG